MTSWNAFYERTNTRAPSLLLSCAIDHAKHLHPLHAVDLGCGAVNETLQMIQAGWQVLAIDTGDGNWVSRDFVQSLVWCFASNAHIFRPSASAARPTLAKMSSAFRCQRKGRGLAL